MQLRLISYLVLIFISLQFHACTKEDIRITTKDFFNSSVYFGDTVRIEYTVDGADFDSVCLLLNDSVWFTNNPSQTSFIFIFDQVENGYFEAKIEVYNGSKVVESMPLGRFNCYKLHAPVKITYTTYDYKQFYFVGDSLRIGLSPEWPSTSLTKFREATFYLNGISLGTKTSLPFSYTTDKIISHKNSVKVVMLDNENHIYTTEDSLFVPVNTSPYLSYDIGFGSYLLPSGNFLSTDKFFITTRGWDNIQVDYVNYFLDNRLIMSDSVKSPQYFRDFLIDTLSPGKHTTYCISYDDRGDSTISEIYDITIYKAIDIGERIKDFVNTGDEHLIYALSASSLYSIDPIREVILDKTDLPFENATCMDYDQHENKLFIGFEDGHLVYYNEIADNFITQHTFADGISDIGLDPSLGIGIIVSGTKISLLDFTNSKLVTSGQDLYEGSELVMLNSEQKVIAGGWPGVSGGNLFVYKFSYDQDTLFRENKREIGGSLQDLHLKPDHSQFVYLGTHNTSGLPVYAVDNLELIIKVGDVYARTCAYNTQGNRFYIGYSEGKFECFDANSYAKQFDYRIYFNTYFEYERLISNATDTRIVFSTRNRVDDHQGHLVFFRTTE